MLDREGFRPNVGIILLNARNQVFWGKRLRTHSWQFPQGGIKYGETPEQAMFRELHEEVGLLPEHVQIVARTRDWLRYEVPDHFIRRDARGHYRGQKQIWFLLRLVGRDSDMNLRATDHPEFDAWRWNDYWVPLDVVIEFKRDVYEMALTELARFLPRVHHHNRYLRAGMRSQRHDDERRRRRRRAGASPPGNVLPGGSRRRSAPQTEHEVVAVDQLGLVGVAQQRLDLRRRLARDEPRFGCSSSWPGRARSPRPPGARTAITSPRWKSPCTSTTPIGSRLLPSSRSFGTAPSSTTTAPRSCRWSTIHCLRAASFGVAAISARADAPRRRPGAAARRARGPRR